LIDRNAILNRLDAERRNLARQGEALDVLPHVTRIRRTDREGHYIAFSSLTEGNADAVIADQVAYYRAAGVEMEWKVYGHDTPADLTVRLARHGFVIGPREAVMVLDLHDAPAWVRTPPAQPVLRVATAARVALFRAAAEDIFSKNYQLTAGDITRALQTGSTEHLAYIGIEGGRAVSIGRLYTHPDSAFGGLYGGATRPTHRRQGWYRAVVAARAREALGLGARYLMVDALPTSRPILEGLGFRKVTDTWPCVFEAANTRS
jgi:hypothetical protein